MDTKEFMKQITEIVEKNYKSVKLKDEKIILFDWKWRYEYIITVGENLIKLINLINYEISLIESLLKYFNNDGINLTLELKKRRGLLLTFGSKLNHLYDDLEHTTKNSLAELVEFKVYYLDENTKEHTENSFFVAYSKKCNNEIIGIYDSIEDVPILQMGIHEFDEILNILKPNTYEKHNLSFYRRIAAFFLQPAHQRRNRKEKPQKLLLAGTCRPK